MCECGDYSKTFQPYHTYLNHAYTSGVREKITTSDIIIIMGRYQLIFTL